MYNLLMKILHILIESSFY